MEGEPKLDQFAIALDDSYEGDPHCETTKGKCIRRPETRDQKAVRAYRSQAEEYPELADLNGFPNLAAMLAPRRSTKRRNRRKKNKVTQSQPQPQPQIQAAVAVEEENLANTHKAVETIKDGDYVRSTLAIDLSSSSDSKVAVANVGSPNIPREMVLTEEIAREDLTRIESQECKFYTAKEVEGPDRETGKTLEPESAPETESIMPKKFFCGPRYFDHPEGKWGTCSKCGEDDHTAVNCMVKKQKKPCFICGGLDHRPKKCKQKHGCLICGGRGHHARDCTEKQSANDPSSKICLRCGYLGHDLFSCDNNYSPNDLKKIQCYVCKDFGHLCCANFIEDVLSEVSCYNCGQTGHLGSGCTELGRKACGFLSASLCFKCGKEGHCKRDCLKQAKAKPGRNGLTNPGRYVEEKTCSSMLKGASRRRKRGKTLYKEMVHMSEDKCRQKANWNTAQPEKMFGGEPALYAGSTDMPAYNSFDQFSNPRWLQQLDNNHTGTSSLQAYQKIAVGRDVQISTYTLYSKFLSPQCPTQILNHHVGTFLKPQYPEQIFNHHFGASSSQVYPTQILNHLGTFLGPQFYPQQIFNHHFGASGSQAYESVGRRNP